MELLALTATIAAILGFVYLVFIGQKNIFEYLRERKQRKNLSEEAEEVASPIIDSSSTIPQNLPPRGDFVGREDEKKQVHEALKSRSFIVMIDGIGGIGKTSLALEVLHECLAASQADEAETEHIKKFDAFIWTSAKDRNLALNDVLDTIARTLDYPYITQLSPEEKLHETTRRLREKSCLLIVDNFETVTDDALAKFIQELPNPSKCLITSRVQSLRQARAVSIRGMEHDEARQLIANEGNRLGLDLSSLSNDEQHFQRFYEATGGAPLAIRWSIGQIKQRGQSIDGVLASLYDARGDIFEAIFERAWSLLSKPAVKILTIMPIFAASASKDATEAASDVHKFELDEGLGQLVELWLLEASDKLDAAERRYNLHPLTRAYAQKRLSEQGILERQARVRLAKYFEQFAIERGGDKYTWERYDEIDEEKDNIFGLIEWCFANEEGLAGMRLTKAVTFFMEFRGYRKVAFVFGNEAAHIARKQMLKEELAFLLMHGIGWLESKVGNTERAEKLAREGLKIYEDLNDINGIINATQIIGRILRRKKEFTTAQRYFEKSMKLAISINNNAKQIALRREFAYLKSSENKLVEAQGELETLVPIIRANHEVMLAGVLGALADIYIKLKNYDQAFKAGNESLKLAKKMKKKGSYSRAAFILAKVEMSRENYHSVIKYAGQALEFYEKFDLYEETINNIKDLIYQAEQKLIS